MTHIWLRAEGRDNESRVGLTPDGARGLLDLGFKVSVEDSKSRCIPIQEYREVGCEIVPEFGWPDAPDDAVILGLKELPDDGTPLRHRHIMFGHAYKGQHSGQRLLDRFKAGGGTLYDLEYLVDPDGRRVAAFGYWAGFAGAAVSFVGWAAQRTGSICPSVSSFPNKGALISDLSDRLGAKRPTAIVIGAKGRVGAGAADLCEALGVDVTRWDMAETAHGGPFPEIMTHDLFFNCILARPGTPVFVGPEALDMPRNLSMIGDIACDPDSDYNPVPIYSETTSWAAPCFRACDAPVLDVMAIDNLPSLLPLESSQDFAAQLLPHLQGLDRLNEGVWGRAAATFADHLPAT